MYTLFSVCTFNPLVWETTWSWRYFVFFCLFYVYNTLIGQFMFQGSFYLPSLYNLAWTICCKIFSWFHLNCILLNICRHLKCSKNFLSCLLTCCTASRRFLLFSSIIHLYFNVFWFHSKGFIRLDMSEFQEKHEV